VFLRIRCVLGGARLVDHVPKDLGTLPYLAREHLMAIDNPSKATTSPILRAASPVRLNGQLDPALSRFMWLVKWLLAIPHVVLLGLLWVAVVAVSIVAFFAIVFTGRYPRSLFDFTVGVLRWTWRVGFYAYNAIGTDRYPPFTLGPAPEYAATIDVAYPEHLSRGLVLVKWLLAIPHYFVLAIFLGGGAWLWNTQDARWFWGAGGLISILVLVAGCALAVTGEYPRGLFDVLLGLNRWVYRVWAYVLLMTDAYPPWRFDPGPEPTSGSLAPGRRPITLWRHSAWPPASHNPRE